jgi:multidrug resistance efflux pump
MMKKFLKIIGSTKIIIPAAFLIAAGVGFWVYKTVGYAPKMEISNQTSSVSDDPADSNDQVVDLAFPKTGRVNAIFVKPGDSVKKGEVLANLDFQDTEGALEIAKANYQKIIDGATGADIDVTKTAVQAAQTNLDTVTEQQNLAVKLAHQNLLSSTPEAIPANGTNDYAPPTITGSYLLDKEGTINLNLYYSDGGASFSASGLVDGTGMYNSIIPQPIGDSGLYISFPSIEPLGNSGLYVNSPSGNVSIPIQNWVIKIPNEEAPNYLANYNAYQSALQNQKNAVAVAQSALDQANSALLLKVQSARPEDVAAALGALQVAQGAYDNNFIYAPEDGTITIVNLGVGEIALANERAISMIINTDRK